MTRASRHSVQTQSPSKLISGLSSLLLIIFRICARTHRSTRAVLAHTETRSQPSITATWISKKKTNLPPTFCECRTSKSPPNSRRTSGETTVHWSINTCDVCILSCQTTSIMHIGNYQKEVDNSGTSFISRLATPSLVRLSRTIRHRSMCFQRGTQRRCRADNVGTGDRGHLGDPQHAHGASVAGSATDIASVSVGAAGDIVRATRGHGEWAAAESTCHP
jgi:hypothetical protein